MKIHCVAILLALVITSALPAAVAAENKTQNWYFKVFLDGKEVGFHSFALTDNELTKTLVSSASFDVKILFFNAYRYRHKNTEVWQDLCLRSIESTTQDGKEEFSVSGSLQDSQLLVRSKQGDSVLPECVSSFAYWQPQALKVEKLLNGQTGMYEDVIFRQVGREDFVKTGESKGLAASRYLLSTKSGDIHIWYALKDNIWLGLEATVDGKRTLRYELSDAL